MNSPALDHEYAGKVATILEAGREGEDGGPAAFFGPGSAPAIRHLIERDQERERERVGLPADDHVRPYDGNLHRAHRAIVDASYALSACAHDATITESERAEAQQLLGAVNVAKLAICIARGER